jgi:hypothetical protein
LCPAQASQRKGLKLEGTTLQIRIRFLTPEGGMGEEMERWAERGRLKVLRLPEGIRTFYCRSLQRPQLSPSAGQRHRTNIPTDRFSAKPRRPGGSIGNSARQVCGALLAACDPRRHPACLVESHWLEKPAGRVSSLSRLACPAWPGTPRPAPTAGPAPPTPAAPPLQLPQRPALPPSASQAPGPPATAPPTWPPAP